MFMTLMSCHRPVSDNSDKWFKKLFKSTWLIDEAHSVNRVFRVLISAAFPVTVFVHRHLHRKCLYTFILWNQNQRRPTFFGGDDTMWKRDVFVDVSGKIFSILVRAKNKCAGHISEGRRKRINTLMKKSVLLLGFSYICISRWKVQKT